MPGERELDGPDRRASLKPRQRRHDGADGARHACAPLHLPSLPDNPFLEETLYRYFNLSLRIWYLVLDRLPHMFQRVHEHEEMLAGDRRTGTRNSPREIVTEHIATFEREIRSVL